MRRMTDEQLDAAIGACDEAAQGPWEWMGLVNGSIELRGGKNWCGLLDQRLVTSVRSDPCFVFTEDDEVVPGEQPCENCRKAATTNDYDGEFPCLKPENLNTVWVTNENEVLRPINEWAVKEKHYRNDVRGVTHPTAAHIAKYDPSTVKALLTELRAWRAASETIQATLQSPCDGVSPEVWERDGQIVDMLCRIPDEAELLDA